MNADRNDLSSLEALRKRDKSLSTMVARGAPTFRRGRIRNLQLERLYTRLGDDPSQFDRFEASLAQKGLFHIRVEEHFWRDSDRLKHTHTLARAAVTDMWPMGTSYWVRDNAIIAARLLCSHDTKRQRVGAKLLLSAVSFMSSNAQRDRFKSVIRSKSARFRNDPQNWPHIFADIKENLSCQRQERWSHKQDAWQIAAFHLLEALEAGQISCKLLSDKDREFLGLIIPFLANVECWKCENSGSWEEIPAVRTSVRAWEHRLIVRLGELSRRPEYRFLEDVYASMRRHLAPALRKTSLITAVKLLDRKLCSVMLRDLPFESPHYAKHDPRYRESDATLLYLLELDYPQFLALRTRRSAAWAKRLESRLLSSVLSLQDRASGGIYRYTNDTYQREGYFSNETVAKLTAMYGGPSADASSNFVGRELILPVGRKAAWTHFVWQLCWWGARQYIRTGERRYHAIHERFFKLGLRLVTCQTERSIDMTSDGVSRVVRIPAWRMPECYIAVRSPNGREIIVPSPHTPLAWATAEMLHAFTLRRRLLAHG